MKCIISSYGKEKSLRLYDINLEEVKLLSSVSINAPSFCVIGDKYIFTYEKASSMLLKSYQVLEEKLVLIDTFDVGGSSITHLVYSQKHNVLYGCSYQDGTYFAIKVDDGKFIEMLNFNKQITDERLSRCHCVFLNKNETVLGIVNIALDAIYLYDIKQGKLDYKDIIYLPKGCGPRHAIFNKSSSIIYTITEYSNEVFVIDYETKELLQRISTTAYSGETSGATLLLNQDEDTLYASNRGDDVIAYYKVLGDKTLCYVDSFSVWGKHSRHMIISNDDRYIISCNMNSNNVVVIDLVTKKPVLNIECQMSSCAIDLSISLK